MLIIYLSKLIIIASVIYFYGFVFDSCFIVVILFLYIYTYNFFFNAIYVDLFLF